MPATVRPFVAHDIAEVGELHRRVFRLSCDLTDEQWARAYREYFSDVFLNPSLCDGAGASLVYERDGRIRGFLGVMPRRMSFNGRPVRMAVCSQFAVDPAERGQAGLRMLKHCFDGPQDFTITDEAGDETRRVWEWCGGERVLAHSMRWIRPLRPVQLGLSMLAQRKSLTLLARAVAADARILDALIGKLGAAGPRAAARCGSSPSSRTTAAPPAGSSIGQPANGLPKCCRLPHGPNHSATSSITCSMMRSGIGPSPCPAASNPPWCRF